MRIEIQPGVRLYVDIDGMGLVPDGARMREKPTVVLVHGGPGFDHSGFKPRFTQLTDLAQVVYYDHRSQGRSDDRPKSEWNLDTWADDIVRLCDALGVTKPIVIGQSFGGMVVQHYLGRHPDHPAKAVISSTSGRRDQARVLDWFEKLGGPEARLIAKRFWEDPSVAAHYDEYIEKCFPLYNTTPQAPGVGATKLRRDVLEHWQRGESWTMNLLPGLANVRCPTLVMGGDKDPVCPIEDMREIAAAIPARWCRFIEFPNVGHGAWRDAPEAAMAVLRGFIAEPLPPV